MLPDDVGECMECGIPVGFAMGGTYCNEHDWIPEARHIAGSEALEDMMWASESRGWQFEMQTISNGYAVSIGPVNHVQGMTVRDEGRYPSQAFGRALSQANDQWPIDDDDDDDDQ